MLPDCRYRGTGPRLYAHPGGPGLSSREFAPDLGGLERIFEVGYIDARGTGATPKPKDTRAYALDDYVDDLATLVTEPAFLLGFSHGGLVAQAFASRFPERLLGLILVSTAARFSSDVDAALRRKIESARGEPWINDAVKALEEEQSGAYGDDADLALVLAREMPLYFHRFDRNAKTWVELLAGDLCNGDALRYFNEVEFRSIDLRPELPNIAATTVVICGADDFICPREAADEMHGLIARSTLTVIPESGHMVFVEQPRAFYDAVSAVLK